MNKLVNCYICKKILDANKDIIASNQDGSRRYHFQCINRLSNYILEHKEDKDRICKDEAKQLIKAYIKVIRDIDNRIKI